MVPAGCFSQEAKSTNTEDNLRKRETNAQNVKMMYKNVHLSM